MATTTKKTKTEFFQFLSTMKLHSKTNTHAPFVASNSDAYAPVFHLIAALSARETNAQKRIDKKLSVSPFAKVTKTTAQSFRIDVALQEWHSEQELTKLPELDDCSLARIRSHVAYLQKHYANFCRIERNGKQFRFVTI
ncbi:hypothetical protein [Acinetobacter sp.]|uniref:hypothetical protein n=1 Tax=Acinetobacter sp. TaxID=472 RepID=UPI003D054C3B